MDKVLLIDKSAGWTSFDVVAKIRGQLRAATGQKKIKVGHAGTLDPFATGLLIVLVGAACKRQDQFMGLDKTYEFTIKLGQTSSTGDPEGEITDGDQRRPTTEQIKKVIKQFTGEITQTPPAHSAIKINGQRAYKLARQGKTVDMPTRTVKISSLELVEYSYPEVKAIAVVSKGTYIRSLAEDIGLALGVGGYCLQLRRTKIGDYSVGDALTVEQFETNIKS